MRVILAYLQTLQQTDSNLQVGNPANLLQTAYARADHMRVEMPSCECALKAGMRALWKAHPADVMFSTKIVGL